MWSYTKVFMNLLVNRNIQFLNKIDYIKPFTKLRISYAITEKYVVKVIDEADIWSGLKIFGNPKDIFSNSSKPYSEFIF